MVNWEEAKMKYDKLVQTDKATIPKEQKSLSDYLYILSPNILSHYLDTILVVVIVHKIDKR